MNLDGTVASISDGWNRTYYGRDLSATDILIRQTVHPKQASALVNMVTSAGKAP